MRCEACSGTGKQLQRRLRAYQGVQFSTGAPTKCAVRVAEIVPCAACGGSGIAHCCEGECAQPDPAATSGAAEDPRE